jgi:hypothetical protein
MLDTETGYNIECMWSTQMNTDHRLSEDAGTGTDSSCSASAPDPAVV